MSFQPLNLLWKASRIRAIGLAGAASAALAGCGTDYAATGTIIPEDYHQRHPIVLAEAPTTLDVFPVGQDNLDGPTISSIKGFAERYRSNGSGRITILSPSGSRYAGRGAVDQIRRVLADSGLHGTVALGVYRVANPALAAPIRVSFVGLKAGVASRCGQWPRDLASGGSTAGWENAPYWNFGCATQSVLAAEVDDPRDFAVARALDPADEDMRLRAIGNVRKGADPATDWKIKITQILAVGKD